MKDFFFLVDFASLADLPPRYCVASGSVVPHCHAPRGSVCLWSAFSALLCAPALRRRLAFGKGGRARWHTHTHCGLHFLQFAGKKAVEYSAHYLHFGCSAL